MPELPEVETTLNGIAPYLSEQTIRRLVVRNRRLRWPVPAGLEQRVKGSTVQYLQRRGKYLLLGTQDGGMLIHLGMSGSMRVLPQPSAPGPHEHFDIETKAGQIIRYRDPRRFGCLLWQSGDLHDHHLLSRLGVEPLSDDFSGATLHHAARKRKVAVKNLIMNGEIVVGVGNIYASEALFRAGIHPLRAAGRISAGRYELLAHAIRETLTQAIRQGGTTLRDFVRSDGQPGYFVQQLLVYDRAGQACFQCQRPIRRVITGQRATYYCAACQR